MKRPFTKIWKETLIIALCFILLGLFILIKPDVTLTFFSNIVGAFILMLSFFAFYKHYRMQKSVSFELAYGIVCLVGSLLLFFNKEIVTSMIPVVLGGVMVANCAFKISYIFDLKRIEIDHWYLSLILLFAKLIVGIILIVQPFDGYFDITITIGVLSLTYAICDVLDLIIIRYYLNDIVNENVKVNKINKDIKVEEIENE